MAPAIKPVTVPGLLLSSRETHVGAPITLRVLRRLAETAIRIVPAFPLSNVDPWNLVFLAT